MIRIRGRLADLWNVICRIGVVALAIAGTLFLPRAASAGTYPMNQCLAAPSRTLSANWGMFGSITDGELFNTCGSGGGFGLADAGSMAYNTIGGLRLAVPDNRPHVTMVHVEGDITVGAERINSSGGGDQPSFFRISGSGQVVFEQEMTGWSQPISRDLPGTRDLQIGIYCTYGNGPQDCFWSEQTLITIRRAVILLQEDVPPAAEATGGTVMSGAPVSGTQTLSYIAMDGDSGVHDVSVKLGNPTVGTDSYGSECTYEDWNACPTRADQADMSVDTSLVPDGTYPLRFVVTDGAGNTAEVDTGRIVTVSSPRSMSPGAVPNAIKVQLLAGQGQSRALRTTYGRKFAVIGQALSAEGKPLADATIKLSAQVAQAGQGFDDISQTQTDATGGFAFNVPPGPNRTLRFTYTSPVAVGVQTEGQSDLVVQVRAAAHLAVSDHRVAGGRRVTFRGQLDGGPIPPSGVPIGFRGQVGKHVRKFGDTQTDARGRFRLTYKMPAAGPRKATYPIWVRVGADGDSYPYLPGLSHRVHVTVLR